MNKSIKLAINIVTWTLIGIVLLFALLLAGLRIFGYKTFVVVSPSMEPDIKTGSLVYVKDVKPGEIEVGDVITYALDKKGNTATHKLGLIQNTISGTRYYTYGINNDNYQYDEDGNIKTDKHGNKLHVFDPYTTYDNIQGVVKFSVPYLGRVADFISNPPGIYVAIAFGALLILLVFLPDILYPQTEKVNTFAKDIQAVDPKQQSKKPAEGDVTSDKVGEEEGKDSNKVDKA